MEIKITDFSEIDLSNIKGAILDLDNTFYNYSHAHNYALSETKKFAIKALNISSELFDVTYKTSRDAVHKRLNGQAAMHSRLLYFTTFVENLFNKTDIVWATKLEIKYWSAFFKEMHLGKDIIPFFERCKELNITICICTDLTAYIQYQKMIYWGLHKYNFYMVTSEEAGIEKPSPVMFSMCLEKMNIPAENTIMVGDSKTKDVQGALNIGIKAYHFINYLHV